jgi:peroxiredoxin
MKKLTSLFILIALLASCKPETKMTCLISGTVKNAADQELKVAVGTRIDTLKLNADGTFSKEIALTKAADAVIQGKKMYAAIYLVPGKDLVFTVDGTDFNKDLAFSGTLAPENNYLLEKTNREGAVQERLNTAFRSPYTPADFKRIRDSIRLADLDFLEKFTFGKEKLTADFVERQKTVIRFGYYGDLGNYPRMTFYYNTDKPEIPADWYSFLDGVVLDDPALLDIPDAKYFITSYVGTQAQKIAGVTPENSYNNPEVRKATFAYLLENFKNPEFFNLIAFESLKGTIDSDGPFGMQAEISEYLAKSTDEANKKALNEMIALWAEMAPGKPAPVFNLPDIDGKMVSLNEFAGKYVFIDYWATWCGPCKAEIPEYKRLIADYKTKNVVFISISVDKDKAAWEKMVRKGLEVTDPETGKPVVPEQVIAMDWLQLHDAVKYNKIWLVKYIPTFVLIDPQGKIVNARAQRPSNPVLRSTLDALPGI